MIRLPIFDDESAMAEEGTNVIEYMPCNPITLVDPDDDHRREEINSSSRSFVMKFMSLGTTFCLDSASFSTENQKGRDSILGE